MVSLKLSIFSLQILLLSLLLVRTTLASVHDEDKGDKKEAGEASTAGEAGASSKPGSPKLGSNATPAGSLSRGNSGILEPEAVGEVVGSDSHHSSAPNSKHPSYNAATTGSLSRGTSVGEPEGISGLEAEAGGIVKDKSGSSSSSSSSSKTSHSSKASSVNGTPKGSGEEKENAKSDHSSPKGLGSGHHTPGKSVIQATVPIESGSPSASQGHFVDPAVLKERLEALENHEADGEAPAEEEIPKTASAHSSGRSTPKGSGKLSRGPSGNHMLDRDGSDIVEKGDGGIGSGSHNSSNNSSKHSSKPASRHSSKPDSRHSSGTATPNGTGPGEPYADGFNSLKEANLAPGSPKLPSGHVSPEATGSGTPSRGNSGIFESKAAEDFGADFWKDDLFDEHPKSVTGSTHSSRPGSGNASPTVALSRGNSGKLSSHSGPPSSEQDIDLADALSGGGKYADPDMRSHHSSGQTTPNGSLSRSISGHLSDAEGQKHVPSHSGHPSSENGFDLVDASGAGLHEAHAEMSGKVETLNDDGTSSQRSPHSSKTHSRNSSFGAGSVADSLADHAEDPTANLVHSATGHSVAIDEDGSQVLGNANREYIGSGMPSGDEENENGLGNVAEERNGEEERMGEMDAMRVHDTANAESADGNMDDSMAGIGAENVEDSLANSDPEYVHGSPRARSLSSSSSGHSGSGRFNVRDVGNDAVDEPEPSPFDADELRATENEGITSDDGGDSSPLHRSKPKKLSVDIPKSSLVAEDMVPNPSGSSQHNSPIGGHRSKHLNQEAVEEEGTPIGGPQHSPIHLLGGGSSHGSSHGSQAGSHGSHSQAGSAQASPTGSQAGSHHDSTAGEAKSRDDGSSSGSSTSPKDSPKSLGAVALGHSGSGRFHLSPDNMEKKKTEISDGGSANSSPRDSKPEAHLHGHAKSEDHAAEGTGKGTKTGHEDAEFNDVVANDKRALEAFLKSKDHPAGENMNIFETAATRMEHDLLDCTNKSPKHDKHCVHWQLLQLAFVKWFKFVAAVERNPHNTEAYAQIAVRPNFHVKDANVHPKHNKPVPGTPGTVAQVMEITSITYPAGKNLDIDNHKVLKFVTAKVDGHAKAKHASHPDGKMKSHHAGEADVLKKIFVHEKAVLAGQRVDFEDADLKKALSKYKEPKDSGIVKMLLDFFTKMASYLKIGSSSPKGNGSPLPQANPAAAGTAAHHSGLAHSPSRATHHTGAKPETHHHHAGAAVPATGGNSASSSPGAAAAAAHVHQHHQQKKQESPGSPKPPAGSPGSPAGHHPHTPTGRR